MGIADALDPVGRQNQVSSTALAPPGGANAGSSGSAYASSDIFKEVVEKAKSDDERAKQKSEEVSSELKANRQKLDDLKTPKIPELSAPPKPKDTNPLEGFGSAAGWIAVFGSMLTRSPLTNSLNASAAAMNAVKENNASVFKQKMEEWKASTENALQLHQFEMDSYKADIDKIKEGDNSAWTDMQVTAASMGNKTLTALIAAGNHDEALRYHDAMLSQGKKVADTAIKTEQYGLFMDYKLSHPEAKPEELAKKLMEFTQPSVQNTELKGEQKKEESAAKAPATQTVRWISDQVAKNGIKPNVLAGYDKDMKRAIAADMAQRYPNVNLAAVEANAAGMGQEQRTESGIAGRVVSATNALDNSLPVLEEAFSKVDLGKFTDLNQIENYAREHSSDPDFQALLTAVQTTENDYSALIGSRGGGRTDSTDAAAHRLLNANMGNGAKGFISQVRKEQQMLLESTAKTTGRYQGAKLPKDAVSKLKTNPSIEMQIHFDDVFGSGAAEKALKQ